MKVCPKCNGDQHLTVLPQHYRLKCGMCGHVVILRKRNKK